MLLTLKERHFFQQALDISIANLNITLQPVNKLYRQHNLSDVQIYLKEYVAFAKKSQWTCSKQFYDLGQIDEKIVPPQKNRRRLAHEQTFRTNRARDAANIKHQSSKESKAKVIDAWNKGAWETKTEAARDLKTIFKIKETEIIIAVDNDSSGRGQRAAIILSDRMLAEGRKVRRVMPPKIDSDFADLLLESY